MSEYSKVTTKKIRKSMYEIKVNDTDHFGFTITLVNGQWLMHNFDGELKGTFNSKKEGLEFYGNNYVVE